MSGVALLAMVLALFMILTAAQTHACPGMAAGAAHQAKSAAVVMAAMATPKADIAPDSGACCGGALHAHGAGWSHGCCASCSAAVVGAASVVVFQDVAVDHALRRERRVAWAIPDRNFRPPRSVS